MPTRWRTRSRPSSGSTTGWRTPSLPSVMAFNRGVSRSRLARVAVAMESPRAVEDVLAGLAIDRVRRLVADAGSPRGCRTRE